MRKLLQFVFLMMATQAAWSACSGSSPNWTSTPDSSSLQSCVNNASNGDTVTISGGSATYSSTVTISKGLTIIVATGQTVTLTSSGATSPPFFTITGTGSNFVHISGDNGSGDCSASTSNCGLVLVRQNDGSFNSSAIYVRGPANAFRFDHILGNKGDAFLYSNNDSSATGRALGVIDHSYLENYSRTYFAQDQRSTDNKLGTACPNGTNGGTAWSEFTSAESTYAGSNKEIYWENDTFTWTQAPPSGQGAFYSQYGGKVVVRYSTFAGWSPYVVDEGDNPACGSVYYEIYNNTFNEDCSITGYGCEGKVMDFRSGNLIVHDNAFNGQSIPAELTKYPGSGSLTSHNINNSYFWNNTWNGNSCQTDSNPSGAVCVDVASDSDSPKPTPNTNYWLRAPNQASDVYFGYQPYTYPHPLIGNTVTQVSPPSGLTVTVQ
jgi:hypothetical protein